MRTVATTMPVKLVPQWTLLRQMDPEQLLEFGEPSSCAGRHGTRRPREPANSKCSGVVCSVHNELL